MIFTEEEETILKLMAAEMKARIKLNKVNQEMGDLIRQEFSVIDKRIREENKPLFEPLEQEIKAIKENLKGVAE